jgi:hypothetical protein
MKRIADNTQSVPRAATPTIDNLLNSMARTGLDTYEDRLETYAVLGFYFDGQDYSNKSVKSISTLIRKMDAQMPGPLDVELLEDEDNDRYGFQYQSTEYWLTSPSIRNMPKLDRNNLPKYYRELVVKLADDPDAILALPYYIFGTLSDALGKSLGIA